MTAVVLFEGAGGATRGLHDAGYDTIGFDHWQPAVTCAQANGYDARLHDLSDAAGDHLIPYAPLWWASPPCQPFSAAGDGEGEFDDRDGFPWLLRLTALRLPDVLLIENVKGLTFRKHSAYFCAVLEGFRALGYDVDWRVLCAADYGVPQTRERCIIVCRRDGGPITWPMPTHTETPGMFTAPWVTMAQALGWNDGDLIAYNRGEGMIERHGERGPWPVNVPAPSVTGNTAKDMRRVMLDYRQTRPTADGGREFIVADVTDMPAPTIGVKSQGQWLIRCDDGDIPSLAERAVGLADVAPGSILENPEHIIKQLGAVAGGSEGDEESVSGHSHHVRQPAESVKPQPWPYERPATTIAADNRVFQPGGHHEPGEQSQNAIRLTTEELAALQGFPADWTWTGNKTQQARLIGNACPPALTHAIAAVNRPATLEAAA